MNRSITPILELERQLEQLSQNLNKLPRLERTHKHSSPTYSVNISGILAAFDGQLESLRLEANLLQSEDSPFTQRRRQKEMERARKLSEARALAEAQFERLSREKELAELKARRAEAERQAQIKKEAWESAQAQQRDEAHSALSSGPAGNSVDSDEDWDPSIEYTIMGDTQHLGAEADSNLSIALDDSIFLDLPSQPPEPAFDSVSQIRNSLPPRPKSPVSLAPRPQTLSTEQMNQKQLISLLKGILPAKPRYVEAKQDYVGSGYPLALHPIVLPWEKLNEIVWTSIDLENLEQSLNGIESLSLAPRAFSPSSPLTKRTISLRLKSTEDSIAQFDPLAAQDDEFNLSDFEDQQDSELYQMHETYRALEEQVGEMAFYTPENVINEPRFDMEDSLKSEASFEPGFEVEHFTNTGEEDAFDEGPDLATLDPALPSVDDPFEMLEDLSFDHERLTSDFDWEGNTPTNIFGDEPTPTDVFGDQTNYKSEQPNQEEENLSTNKGLFSRFFGRNK